MFKISLNEIMALSLVLEYSTVEDLLKPQQILFMKRKTKDLKNKKTLVLKLLKHFLIAN